MSKTAPPGSLLMPSPSTYESVSKHVVLASMELEHVSAGSRRLSFMNGPSTPSAAGLGQLSLIATAW